MVIVQWILDKIWQPQARVVTAAQAYTQAVSIIRVWWLMDFAVIHLAAVAATAIPPPITTVMALAITRQFQQYGRMALRNHAPWKMCAWKISMVHSHRMKWNSFLVEYKSLKYKNSAPLWYNINIWYVCISTYDLYLRWFLLSLVVDWKWEKFDHWKVSVPMHIISVLFFLSFSLFSLILGICTFSLHSIDDFGT